MPGSAARFAFALSYQISPIILTNGIAGNIPGGMLPIISLSQSLNFAEGLLGGSDLSSLDDYLFQFHPLQGSELIKQRAGKYTFGNQSVAANAVIRDALPLAMRMDVVAKPGSSGYATKSVVMLALKAALDQHNNSGGTYTIVTPSYIWTDCIMLDLRDISRNDSKQPQNAWQWDFEQPLVTMQAALQAEAQMNSTMTQINGGVPTQGATSGFGPTIGSPPSLATPSVAPAASNLAGANTAGAASLNSFSGLSAGPGGLQ
jgi:hypothetical protein